MIPYRRVVERLYGRPITSRCGFDSRPCNQTGFLLGQFLPYIIVAVVAAGVLGTTYYKGREAGKEVVRAELQPLLTACEGREKALGSQIEAQNRAVEAVRAAGAARQAAARQGVERAQKAAQSALSEAARLREAAKATPVGQCPAGEAVQKVREGLK